MDSSLRLVLFGQPAAGKGTQAQLLKDQLGVSHISSGDLFRYHLKEGTPLGQQAAHFMNQGLLVPDSVTIGVILDKVLSLPREEGFILDGFPRTTDQAEALEENLEQLSRNIDRVLFMNVPHEELMRRLSNRYVCCDCQAPNTVADPSSDVPARCEKCGGELCPRDDDRPEAVTQRIQVYQNETLPLLEFYRERNLLSDVPGVGSVQSVNRRLLEALKQVEVSDR